MAQGGSRKKRPLAGTFLAAIFASVTFFGCGGGGGDDTPALNAGFPVGAEDTLAPKVSDTSPENGASGVSPNSSIAVTFSEPMDATTLLSAVSLRTTAGNVPVPGTVVPASTVARFMPSSNLVAGTQYTGTVTRNARDTVGIQLESDYSWTFTAGGTADATPPTVSALAPVNNAINVSINTSVAASFSEAMTNSTINVSSFGVVSTVDGADIPGTVSVNGTTARFTPTSPLSASTQFTVAITTDVKDAAGNALATPYSWTFTTAAAPDTTRPTVIALSPANGSTNVALNSAVTATFSEPMTNSSLNTASFTLRPTAGGAAIGGTVNVTGNTARFTPSANLAGDTQYTATVTTQARDAAGNQLAAPFTWRFRTEPLPDTRAPTVASTSPANGATSVAVDSLISASFSEPMKNSTLTTASFTVERTIGGAPVAGTVGVVANTVTFTPVTALDPTVQYTAKLSTAIQDLAGNPLDSEFTWSFTTATSDNTPPAVNGASPSPGATGVPLNTTVSAIFSEPMDNATLNTTSFTLVRNGVAVAGTVDVSGTTVTFTPSAALAAGTYTATLSTAVRDASGNPLASSFAWSFTTVAAIDTTATLTWDAVTAPALAGYRVYYGTSPGSYNQAAGAGIPVAANVLTYTVTGLNTGTTYYFAVTAYDTSNNESPYSNEVFKVILP